MIDIDITLVWHIINMIVLMYVLNAILYKPILAILDQRAKTVQTLSGDVVHFDQKARSRQAELDKKMREASNRAKKALETARAQAQAVGAEKIAAIRKESDTEKAKAQDALQAQIETARKQLQENTAGFARAMAEKILGRSIGA